MVVDWNMLNKTWINTLGTINSKLHDLPGGGCNVIESFPLEMATSSSPNFPTDGFEASTTDVTRHRLPYPVQYVLLSSSCSGLCWKHIDHNLCVTYFHFTLYSDVYVFIARTFSGTNTMTMGVKMRQSILLEKPLPQSRSMVATSDDGLGVPHPRQWCHRRIPR